MIVLKALAITGIVLCAVLMLRKQKRMASDPGKDPVTGLTFRETWDRGMKEKNLTATFVIGVVANFFDTLGIGSFAPTAAAFKLTGSVDDVNIPGTMNVGDTIPMCVEAYLSFGFVDMDLLTLVSMICASIAGAYLMAGVVARFSRRKVRYALFVSMFIVASVMLCKVLGVGPFGDLGTGLGLRGVRLIIAVVCNFILGGLMSIGVGLYAPCMALCVLLGLDAGCAFPAMMGSCAFLMAYGNCPRFIAEGRYDPVACWTQAIGGTIGVVIAYFIVKSMDLRTLTFMMICICYVTSLLFLHDAVVKGEDI